MAQRMQLVGRILSHMPRTSRITYTHCPSIYQSSLLFKNTAIRRMQVAPVVNYQSTVGSALEMFSLPLPLPALSSVRFYHKSQLVLR